MRRAAGFTLLEVMVALAILSLSLVVLLQIATNNVRATNHAKLMTAATFLARGKMVDIEGEVLQNGFSDIEADESGSFEDEGYPNFRFNYLIEKVELPSDIASKTQEAAGEVAASDDPMQALGGLVGGMMGSFIEPIRVGLQESVRRITLRVAWDELGRPEQSLEVVTFMTDPAKLDVSLPAIQSPAGQL